MRTRLLRWLRRRRHGQGLVEYGAVAAALTLVGLLGLQALTSAQVAYFNNLSLAAPVPAPVGDLLHAAAIDAPTCTPNLAAVNQTVSCTGMAVHDVYRDVTDRVTPTGTLGLYVDTTDFSGTPLATCVLSLPTRDSNACAGPLQWTPGAAMAGGYHTLYVVFSCNVPPATASMPFPSCPNRATSNHFLASVAVSVAVAPPVAFTPVCNSQNVEGWNFEVELGHPMRCRVTANYFEVTGPPAANVDVVWTVANDPLAGAGTPLLSCAENGDLRKVLAVLYTPGPCTPGPATTCRTDAQGQCWVNYRLTRFPSGAQVLQPRTQGFVLSTSDGANSATFPNLFTVAHPPGPHSTYSWLTCQSSDPTVHIDAPASFELGASSAQFSATPRIVINGGSGTVTCTATVIDTSPGAALCLIPDPTYGYKPASSGCAPNVDTYDAHAPIGTVELELGSTVSPPCTVDVVTRLGPQAPNQVPYASSCTETLLLTSGIGTSLAPHFFGISPYPTHAAGGSRAIDIEFVP